MKYKVGQFLYRKTNDWGHIKVFQIVAINDKCLECSVLSSPKDIRTIQINDKYSLDPYICIDNTVIAKILYS